MPTGIQYYWISKGIRNRFNFELQRKSNLRNFKSALKNDYSFVFLQEMVAFVTNISSSALISPRLYQRRGVYVKNGHFLSMTLISFAYYFKSVSRTDFVETRGPFSLH